MEIRVDDLRGPEIAALLESHLELMRSLSPPGTVNALDLERLRQPAITFWTVWDKGELVGCGALKELAPDFAEIKSMHTRSARRGRGVGEAMLQHILAQARQRKYTRIGLETGRHPAFDPAHKLYLKYGFDYCEAFADYENTEDNICMMLELGNNAD